MSPAVAQILARLRSNLPTASHPTLPPAVQTPVIPPTIVPTTHLTSTFTANLPAISTAYHSSFLNNTTQSNGSETTQTPSANPPLNLPANFGLLLATHFPLNQLLANALAMRTSQPTFGTSMFHPTFNGTSMPIVPPTNSNANSAMKSPAGRFVSSRRSKSRRPAANNGRRMSNFRGNAREYPPGRGSHQHNNRRGFVPNRNNTRNIVS